jgi:hypothetical protein
VQLLLSQGVEDKKCAYNFGEDRKYPLGELKKRLILRKDAVRVGTRSRFEIVHNDRL